MRSRKSVPHVATKFKACSPELGANGAKSILSPTSIYDRKYFERLYQVALEHYERAERLRDLGRLGEANECLARAMIHVTRIQNWLQGQEDN